MDVEIVEVRTDLDDREMEEDTSLWRPLKKELLKEENSFYVALCRKIVLFHKKQNKMKKKIVILSLDTLSMFVK